MAQTVDLVVDRRVFFDVKVPGRQVGLRLVVVVVADKVFDGVVGEKRHEFGRELSGQGLVMRDDQGGALCLFDDRGHGEGFAGSRDAQKRLPAVAA